MFYGLFCGFVRHTAAFCSGFHFCLKGENKGEKHRRFSPLFYVFCRPALREVQLLLEGGLQDRGDIQPGLIGGSVQP